MIGTLSDMQKAVLKQLQEGIPLEKEPFKEIARKTGIDEDELFSTINNLKEEKIIRQISPIYDTKSLGYDSSLVAFRVEENLEDVAKIINQHPGVSHNYERTDRYNLWFTIAVPPDSKLGLEKTVKILAERTGVSDYAILKTVKLFKIGVKLDFDSLNEKEELKKNRSISDYVLTELDKQIIKLTQEDIELSSRPFKKYSEQLGIDEEFLIEKLREYEKYGLMRRFAAILYHRKAGFKANGMTVWEVPEERIEEVGYHIASYKSVTHCYQRTTGGDWQYNLFSMIHGKSKEELINFVEKVSQEVNIKNYKILFSTREFKKKRIRYFSEKFYKWERDANDGGHT